MAGDQRQRIEVGLAYPDEYRGIRVLITEDNLVTYGSISTRMKLDPNQLRPFKPAQKKSKPTSGEPTAEAKERAAVPLKKATSSGPLKRKKAVSSSKRPASPKSAASPTLPPTEEAE